MRLDVLCIAALLSAVAASSAAQTPAPKSEDWLCAVRFFALGQPPGQPQPVRQHGLNGVGAARNKLKEQGVADQKILTDAVAEAKEYYEQVVALNAPDTWLQNLNACERRYSLPVSATAPLKFN